MPRRDDRLLTGLLDQAAIGPGDLPVPSWDPLGPLRAADEDARRRLVADGERYRGYGWPVVPARASLGFARTGDRSAYEAPHFARRHALVALALAVGCGATDLLDDLVDGIWATCEESFWGLSAHVRSGRFPGSALPDTAEPTIDLFAAATAAQLAWVDRLAGDALDGDLAVVRDRIRREIDARVLAPYLQRDDWWWLGLAPLGPGQVINNWNSWIHASILTAALLSEPRAGRRARIVRRAIEGLDRFLATYPDDGGCDEGVAYWVHAGGALFESLNLLRDATGGRFDAFALPVVREIGRFPMRMQAGGDWYVNFADGSATPRLDGDLLAAFGDRIGDPDVVAHGLSVRDRPADHLPPGRLDPSIGLELLRVAPRRAGVTAPPLPRDTWLPGTGVLTCRERAGETTGLFLAIKGGHNGESHNHNDVGSLIVAVDRTPLVVDAGVGAYTRQTFSGDRYALWTMRSDHHNVPEVDGHGQPPGAASRARWMRADVGEEATTASLDLATAYPADAGIRRWKRTAILDRVGGVVVLDDSWELERSPRSIVVRLLLHGDVAVDDGTVTVRAPGGGRGLTIHLPPDSVDVRLDRIETGDDPRLGPVWGEVLTLATISVRRPAPSGRLTLRFQPVPADGAATAT